MDTVPNLPPQAYALHSLIAGHLRHLDKTEVEPLSTPQWTASAQSSRTVAGIKFPGQAIGVEDVPMIIGTSAPDRRRSLYSSMPVPPEVAAAADESEVALFNYNRRGRLQPANRTAQTLQSRPWYPPAKTIAPMRLLGDDIWEPVVQATGDTGRPGIFEAFAGWLVLLLLIAFLGASAYLALRYFGII